MAGEEMITIQEKHVGKKVIRAFGKRWRLGFRLRLEDIGRTLCRTDDGDLEIACERDDHKSYPAIFEACSCLSLDFLADASEEAYALGHSGPLGAVTPWFEELELFCEDKLDCMKQQLSVM